MPKKAPRKPIVTRKQKIAAANIAEFAHAVDSVTPNVIIAEEYLENPVQPEIDKNRYRVIKLCNGLTALLVSTENSALQYEALAVDESSDEKDEFHGVNDTYDAVWDQIAKEMRKDHSSASCTLCLDVGNFSDPPDIPGIADILKKVILGSSMKYPQIHSFEKFLDECDGIFLSNASHCDLTFFSFDVPVKYLSDALDRFTNCVANPILRCDFVIAERERQKKNSSDDQRKRVFTSLSSGIKWNRESKLFRLPNNALVTEVKKFMKRHYSANRMKLLIEANLPLDTLEEYARKYFSRVPNNGLAPVDLSSQSYLRFFNMPAFNMFYEMDPITPGTSTIELTWAVPPIRDFYRSKPPMHIMRLIENEEEGSLINFLRKKEWCSGINAYIGDSGYENNTIYSLLTITINLLPNGYQCQKTIIDLVYSYINFLKRVLPNERIYDEIRRTAEGVFRTYNRDSRKPYGSLVLCKNMQFSSSADYLGADILCYEYDPKAIQLYLNCMTPNRANVILYGQAIPKLYWREDAFDSDSQDDDEEVCPLKSFKIPKDWISEWMSIVPLACFRLPEPNVFCPDDFSLLPRVTNCPKYPMKIHSDSLFEVWYKADDKFSSPESRIIISLESNISLQSAETAALFELFCKAVKKLSYEQLFPASVAAMKYGVECAPESISVNACGFNRQVQIVIQIIGNCIGCCSSLVSQELFTVIRNEQLEKYYKTCIDNKSLAQEITSAIIFPVYWTVADKITALSSIQFEKFQYFMTSCTSRVYVKSLVQGNIGASDALEMVRSFIGLSKCGTIEPENRPRFERNEIPPGSSWCQVRSLCPHRTPDFVISYYQFGETSLMLNAALCILKMITNVFIDDGSPLRSVDRVRLLGCSREAHCDEYILAAADSGFSNHILPELRIERFRQTLVGVICGLSDPHLIFIKRLFIDSRRHKTFIDEEMRRNWKEIDTNRYMFDRYLREADVIARLDVQQLRNVLFGLAINNLADRKLTIKIVGRMKSDEEHRNNNLGSIPRTQDMKIELLSDSSRNVETERHHYITDISSYKQTLKTTYARETECPDRMAADFEKSCKL